MRAKSGFVAAGIVAIGVVSAAVVFVLHRTLSSDAPSFETSRFVSPSEWSIPSQGNEPAPLSKQEDDLVATADPVGNESEASVVERRGLEAGPEDEASPRLEALRHPSPGYRNATLTAVIRESGHVCLDVVSSTAGTEDLKTWRVSCEGAHAYLVSDDGAGGLRVEPMPYFEVPVVRPLLVPDSSNTPLRSLPPIEWFQPGTEPR